MTTPYPVNENDRAALIRAIYTVERYTFHADGDRLCVELADAVIAAGWRPPSET